MGQGMQGRGWTEPEDWVFVWGKLFEKWSCTWRITFKRTRWRDLRSCRPRDWWRPPGNGRSLGWWRWRFGACPAGRCSICWRIEAIFRPWWVGGGPGGRKWAGPDTSPRLGKWAGPSDFPPPRWLRRGFCAVWLSASLLKGNENDLQKMEKSTVLILIIFYNLILKNKHNILIFFCVTDRNDRIRQLTRFNEPCLSLSSPWNIFFQLQTNQTHWEIFKTISEQLGSFDPMWCFFLCDRPEVVGFVSWLGLTSHAWVPRTRTIFFNVKRIRTQLNVF